MKAQSYYDKTLPEYANVKNENVDISVNCAGITLEKEIRTTAVRNDFYLMYITDGELIFLCDNNAARLKEGDIVVIAPDTKYHYHSDSDSAVGYYWIHFTGRNAKKILDKMNIKINKPMKAGVRRNICDDWQLLFREFMLFDTLFAETSAGILTCILAKLSRCINGKNNDKTLFKSLEYIHKNFKNDIPISQLARIEGLSESHYRLLFKNITGVSPIEYITARRMESAIRYLCETDKSMSEIATLVGYSDAYYFGRLFKKKNGVSPGKYRHLTSGKQ